MIDLPRPRCCPDRIQGWIRRLSRTESRLIRRAVLALEGHDLAAASLAFGRLRIIAARLERAAQSERHTRILIAAREVASWTR